MRVTTGTLEALPAGLTYLDVGHVQVDAPPAAAGTGIAGLPAALRIAGPAALAELKMWGPHSGYHDDKKVAWDLPPALTATLRELTITAHHPEGRLPWAWLGACGALEKLDVRANSLNLPLGRLPRLRELLIDEAAVATPRPLAGLTALTKLTLRCAGSYGSRDTDKVYAGAAALPPWLGAGGGAAGGGAEAPAGAAS